MNAKRPRTRFGRFMLDVLHHTPITQMTLALMFLWMLSAVGMYFAERNAPDSGITSFIDALYWCVAAFSTAGIANAPVTVPGKLIGGLWSVVGCILFFGVIVATVTTYFMRPIQRPHRKIIDTIEYNLEQCTDLSVEELELLKETTDTLLEHMEQLRRRHEQQVESSKRLEY